MTLIVSCGLSEPERAEIAANLLVQLHVGRRRVSGHPFLRLPFHHEDAGFFRDGRLAVNVLAIVASLAQNATLPADDAAGVDLVVERVAGDPLDPTELAVHRHPVW